MTAAASIKAHGELVQRLAKLKAKQHPKNPLKKLPGYGTTWYFRNAQQTPSEGETPTELKVESADVTAFVKKLRTRPPPEESDEGEGEIVQGPGFEFPTEKEAAKCVKHWAKRFKQWQPSEGATGSSVGPRVAIRFKPPLPSNEVEIDGKRYKRVATREEMTALQQRGVGLIERRPVTLHDARFYAELLKEDHGDMSCHMMTSVGFEGGELKEALSDLAVTEIYAPFSVASKIVNGIKKRLTSQGKGDAAASLRVEVAVKEEDPDEVTQSPSRRRVSDTALEEGDERSVYM